MSREYKNVMREQYYVKKNGRYIPANDPICLDGLTNGAWLVVVKKGSTSCKRYIKPKFLELDAALHYLEEELVNALAEASKARPQSIPLSKKEQKALAAYSKIMGKDTPLYMEYASFSEMASRACQYIKKIMLENNCNKDIIRKKFEIKKVIDTILDLEV